MTTNKPGSVNQQPLYGCTSCYEDWTWPAEDLRVFGSECWCDLCWDERRWEFPDQPSWNDLESYTPALQAECEKLRTKTSVTLGIGNGHGNLFVHGDYDSIKAAQDKIFELEELRRKLAEIGSQEPAIRVSGGRVVDFNPDYEGCVSEGDFYAKPVARITEQDVREIVIQLTDFSSLPLPLSEKFSKWFDHKGRTLLNKLNAGREQVPVPTEKSAVSGLVEALERIANMDSVSYHSLDSAKITARAALAELRRQNKQPVERDRS